MKKIELLPNAIYTAREAEKVICIGRDALKKRIREGKIKASFLGNKYVITGQELLDYLKSELK